MITGWENRDDYWTNTTSPGFGRDLEYRGYLEIRALGSSGLRGSKKNDLRMLRYGTSEPLRQESAADTGSVLWECPDILGSGGTESQVQEVRDSDCPGWGTILFTRSDLPTTWDGSVEP